MCQVKDCKQYIVPECTCIQIYLICIFFYATQWNKVKTLTQGYLRSVRDMSHTSAGFFISTDKVCKVWYFIQQLSWVKRKSLGIDS